MAVSIGHLVFVSAWETDRTQIYLLLKGENYKLSVGLVYTSKLHKELRDKADEKSQEQGL